MTPEIEHPGWPRLYVWSSSGQWAAIVVDGAGNWLWSGKEAAAELIVTHAEGWQSGLLRGS